jgi:hypothetical protein
VNPSPALAAPAVPDAPAARAPSAPRAPAPETASPPAVREAPTTLPAAPAGEAPSLFRSAPPDRGAAPADYDPTRPREVDLDAVRRRAGQLAREGTGNRAVLAFPMPPVPKDKGKLEKAIEKAWKPDCKTAYSSLGLAAVVPLLANEFGEGTCRW